MIYFARYLVLNNLFFCQQFSFPSPPSFTYPLSYIWIDLLRDRQIRVYWYSLSLVRHHAITLVDLQRQLNWWHPSHVYKATVVTTTLRQSAHACLWEWLACSDLKSKSFFHLCSANFEMYLNNKPNSKFSCRARQRDVPFSIPTLSVWPRRLK